MDAIKPNFDRGDVRALSKEMNEPEWLLEHRLAAFSGFLSMPVEKSELFRKYADVSGVGWEGLGLGKNREGKAGARKAAARGLVIEEIRAAAGNHPEILRKYFSGKVGKPDEAKFVALANAAFSSGWLMMVPANLHVEGAIRLPAPRPRANSLSASKNLIILGENSSATIIDGGADETGGRDGGMVDGVLCSQTEFHLKEGAKLTFGSVSGADGNSTLISHKKALLEKDAHANFCGGFLGGGLTISALENVLQGDGAAAEDFEVIFGAGAQKFSITSDLTHVGKNTRGKVAAKGVFRDGSKGLFRGMVRIGKDARNASSYLAGHSILLGRNASSDAIPGLQIENNDVKATHSASVAQIDPEQLFYLMSRGLSEEDAKRTIVEGFITPVMRQMRVKELELQLRALFELKWEGEPLEQFPGRMRELEADMAPEARGGADIFEGHYKYRQVP